jgi:hypothetical protein
MAFPVLTLRQASFDRLRTEQGERTGKALFRRQAEEILLKFSDVLGTAGGRNFPKVFSPVAVSVFNG